MEIFKEIKVTKPKGLISVEVNGPTHGRRTRKTTNTVTKYLMKSMYSKEVITTNKRVSLGDLGTRIALGDGVGVIDYESTSLINQTRSVSVQTKERNDIPIDGETWKGITFSRVLLPGQFTGRITEIGLLNDTDLLAGQALDAPIDVFDDDQIELKYTLAVNYGDYPSVLDSGIINVNGTDYDYEFRQYRLYADLSANDIVVATPHDYNNPIGVNSYNGYVGGGYPDGETSYTYEYNETEQWAEWTTEGLIYASWDGTELSSIRAFRHSITYSEWHTVLIFTPPIPRPSTHKVVFKFRFRYTW